MKNNCFIVILNTLIIGVLISVCQIALAQSNMREGNNSFARYTKTGDFKHLLEARKFADLAYRERRDSAAYNNTLLRGLVYSSLAVADSNRAQSYVKDPIDEAEFTLSRLNDDKLNFQNEPKINYIKQRIANAYLINANRALNNNNFKDAFGYFNKVDSYAGGDSTVRYNLAVISEKLNQQEQAIQFYQDFLSTRETAKPAYVLRLANIHLNLKDNNAARNVLSQGRTYFPNNKDILFKLINVYANSGIYDAIVALENEALSMEPENINLNYLMGYAYEVTGNRQKAEHYYKRTLELNPDDFNSNYELGLLYLKDFVGDADNLEKQYVAQEYLLKANEIDPKAVNALKSLAVLFSTSGNEVQLERVNSQLNQITIN